MASPYAGSFRPAARVVVPVQGTDREFVAEQWAVELAAALALPVHAVHVAPAGSDGEGVFDFIRSVCEKWGVRLTTLVLHGSSVAEELVEELEPRDLVVIGTRRLAQDYHVGSVAADLVRRAPCPVQIMRLG